MAKWRDVVKSQKLTTLVFTGRPTSQCVLGLYMMQEVDTALKLPVKNQTFIIIISFTYKLSFKVNIKLLSLLCHYLFVFT